MQENEEEMIEQPQSKIVGGISEVAAGKFSLIEKKKNAKKYAQPKCNQLSTLYFSIHSRIFQWAI